MFSFFLRNQDKEKKDIFSILALYKEKQFHRETGRKRMFYQL